MFGSMFGAVKIDIGGIKLILMCWIALK